MRLSDRLQYDKPSPVLQDIEQILHVVGVFHGFAELAELVAHLPNAAVAHALQRGGGGAGFTFFV